MALMRSTQKKLLKKRASFSQCEVDHDQISDEEQAAFWYGVDRAIRGEFAPESEMEEFYKLHRRE